MERKVEEISAMQGPRFVIASSIIAFAVLVAVTLNRRPDQFATGAARALDGDSLVIDGRAMRLRGIDAPEYRQTCEIDGKSQPCGRQAAQALRRALGRGPATCVGNELDRYDRLLVVCRVLGQDIGAELVRAGFAVDYGGYPAEEAEAKKAGRGIWAGEFERPEAWRRRNREERRSPVPPA